MKLSGTVKAVDVVEKAQIASDDDKPRIGIFSSETVD